MSTLSNVISSLSNSAASWYNAVELGTPVVTSAQQAAQTQIALNQQAQANLNITNPTLAGILANPATIIFIVLAIVGVIVLVMYLGKK